MIRFGLLGCGRIAKRHSDLLGGKQIEGASLVAVCDPVRARADAVANVRVHPITVRSSSVADIFRPDCPGEFLQLFEGEPLEPPTWE